METGVKSFQDSRTERPGLPERSSLEDSRTKRSGLPERSSLEDSRTERSGLPERSFLEDSRTEHVGLSDRSSFEGSLAERFCLPERDWSQYAPLELAYIGDAVYDLVIRTILVKREIMQPQKLHREVTACVSARAQARMIRALCPVLTPEEESIRRRGRNAKPHTKAKNASMEEYLEATGFEALIGYLYLNGRFARMNELIALGLAGLKESDGR